MAAHTRNEAHRDRLLTAMAELVGERGYAAVTVAEVVGRARVSKRTFYQHFEDRESCFLATYVAAAEGPLTRIAAAATAPEAAALGLREQVARGTGAYLEAMAEQPGLTRTLLTEITAVGPRGWRVRREVLHRFADQLVALVADGGQVRGAAGAGSGGAAGAGPCDPPELSRPSALALVGGINELVLEAVERGRGDRLPELASTATELVVAVLSHHPAAPSDDGR